jgi:hypothetical protein
MRSTVWLRLAWAVLALGCAGSAAPAESATPTVVDVPAAPAVTASSAVPQDAALPPKPKADKPRPSANFTCSMHPHVHEPSAGSCPICGMDLVERTDR